jgi:hypothetical protein
MLHVVDVRDAVNTERFVQVQFDASPESTNISAAGRALASPAATDSAQGTPATPSALFNLKFVSKVLPFRHWRQLLRPPCLLRCGVSQTRPHSACEDPLTTKTKSRLLLPRQCSSCWRWICWKCRTPLATSLPTLETECSRLCREGTTHGSSLSTLWFLAHPTYHTLHTSKATG